MNARALIDTNVYLSRWPARRLPLDEADKLVERLQSRGVTEAWVGSFDALLHRDVADVNARLAAECPWYDAVRLVPFGTVNPMLPDWEDDLRRCAEEHHMPGIRLHPNYHGYALDSPEAARLLALAAERKLIVQIAIRMEDPRTQHPLLQAADVDPTPLVHLLPKLPGLKVQLLSALNSVRQDLLDQLLAVGDVYVDIAMLEGTGGIESLLSHVSTERVLFGSYAPFFAWEAAEMKLRESPLAEAQREAIRQQNARQLLPRAL